jgi:hypothetical protein
MNKIIFLPFVLIVASVSPTFAGLSEEKLKHVQAIVNGPNFKEIMAITYDPIPQPNDASSTGSNCNHLSFELADWEEAHMFVSSKREKEKILDGAAFLQMQLTDCMQRLVPETLPFVSSGYEKPFVIPKLIHFIWMGSPIPEHYLDNIKFIAHLNPDYKIYIWLDDASQTSAEEFRSSQFVTSRIASILMDKVASKTVNNIYQFVLSGAHPNYGAASDVLRIIILIKHGGIYLDTDTYVHKSRPPRSFGELTSRYGLLTSTRSEGEKGDAFDSVNNTPMAAPPDSVALKEALQMIETRYNDAIEEKASWLTSIIDDKNPKERLDATVYLAGPCLFQDFIMDLACLWTLEKGLDLGEIRERKVLERSTLRPTLDYFSTHNVAQHFCFGLEAFGLTHHSDVSWIKGGRKAVDFPSILPTRPPSIGRSVETKMSPAIAPGIGNEARDIGERKTTPIKKRKAQSDDL